MRHVPSAFYILAGITVLGGAGALLSGGPAITGALMLGFAVAFVATGYALALLEGIREEQKAERSGDEDLEKS